MLVNLALGSYVPADPIGSVALRAGLMATLAVGLRMRRARKHGEHERRVLIEWLSLSWLFVTSMILLVPRHTEPTDGRCSFDLTHVAEFAYGWERLLNIVLFVPAGLLCLHIARSARSRMLLVVSLGAMPPLFEALQSTGLIGRTCSATDVVDNWTGLVVGLAISIGLSATSSRKNRQKQDRSISDSPVEASMNGEDRR